MVREGCRTILQRILRPLKCRSIKKCHPHPVESAQPSRAPSAFMSSKKAVYESSILCDFGADEEELTVSGFITTVGAAAGLLVAATAVERMGFDLGFGVAVSLLTRTDAGTMEVSSGVC